jgi:hypothetical protein
MIYRLCIKLLLALFLFGAGVFILQQCLVLHSNIKKISGELKDVINHSNELAELEESNLLLSANLKNLTSTYNVRPHFTSHSQESVTKFFKERYPTFEILKISPMQPTQDYDASYQLIIQIAPKYLPQLFKLLSTPIDQSFVQITEIETLQHRFASLSELKNKQEMLKTPSSHQLYAMAVENSPIQATVEWHFLRVL